MRRLLVALAAVAAPALLAQAPAGAPDSALLAGLRWRMIGPFRGGRTKAAAGIPSQPSVFYVGAVNGGVWRTTDAGRTWQPIFDAQPTGSIGAIAVAPSDANVIYVGSGEGLQRPDLATGDGIYKSTDGGKSWTHLGLREGQQIPQILVDPRDRDRLFVAVLGHPYGPNEERGIFRSTDGGRTFQKVLYKDPDTGGIDLVFDPSNAQTVYAVLWQARQAPWENGAWNGPNSGIYKSTDGGDTWRPIGRGLPTFAADGLGRIGITVAPSSPSRMFATVETRTGGWLYRSDDAGETWTKITDDDRVAGRPSDFAEVKVDPKNPDVVYTANVVTWKSTDGGKTWSALRGAPGGDDYHRIWINPNDPRIILIASDQGAIVTVNGGETWSSWYNQPTAQFYHVTADNAFPYRLCGGQQESGSACVQSRGDDGRITMREWHPVGLEEYGYAAPDPLDPDIVYGGKLTRYDRRTGQTQNIAPKVVRAPGYRVLRTEPVIFSPADPHTLYFASNTVWKTTTGGASWTQISPDLTRRDSVVPPNVGVYDTTRSARARHPGVVYTLAPSPKTTRILWAGTDDGLIHVTVDGGAHWRDVTPPDLKARPWSKVSLMDAGHFDTLTAYAAVNTLRLDDLRPHIYRTHDGGKTWTPITTGIPDGATVNVVREDPKRRGLLYAGTELQVWVSFDDGDHWQSLRRNMPATSIRDLIVKDEDLAVATHGRGFWILDDVAPLRQAGAATAAQDAVLFAPPPAYRWRWNLNTDTPVPPDEPAGENPPDGAIIDYWLRGDARGPVTLDILDAAGALVRRYASTDTADAPKDVGNIPRWWIRPTRVLPANAGAHRFVWDLHYPYPAVESLEYPISATPGDTPREPRGRWALPGRYTVRLTVDGKTYTQPLVVRMDPRVKATSAALAAQFALSARLTDALARDAAALAQLRAARKATPGAAQPADSAGALERELAQLNGDLSTLFQIVEGADAAPTAQALATAGELERTLTGLLARARR